MAASAFLPLFEKLIFTNISFTLKTYAFFIATIKFNILSSRLFFLLIFISPTSSGLISSIGMFLHLFNFSFKIILIHYYPSYFPLNICYKIRPLKKYISDLE